MTQRKPRVWDKASGDKYRINPDFVVPEPTGAKMFGFCALDKFGDAEMKRQGDWMRAAGAKQMRVTVVSDEYPHDPYPHGYWFEGWTDENARQLPFGEAEAPDKGCSPPLIYENGKLASVDRNPKGEKPQALSAKHESAVPEGQTPDPEHGSSPSIEVPE